MGFIQRLAVVEMNNKKVGLINHKGEFVIEPKYETIRSFKEGVAIIHDKKKIFLLKRKNFEMIELKGIRHIGDFSEGLAVAYPKSPKNCKQIGQFKNCDIYYINTSGKIVLTVNTWVARGFHGDLAIVQHRKEDILRYINKKGKIVWPEENLQ